MNENIVWKKKDFLVLWYRRTWSPSTLCHTVSIPKDNGGDWRERELHHCCLFACLPYALLIDLMVSLAGPVQYHSVW